MMQFLAHNWRWLIGLGLLGLLLWFASTANIGGPRGRSDR